MFYRKKKETPKSLVWLNNRSMVLFVLYFTTLYFNTVFLINMLLLLFCTQAYGGAQTDLTRLQFINFWIASIIAHASPPNTGDARMQYSPQIFIVGTHRDSIPDSKGDKRTYVSNLLISLSWGSNFMYNAHLLLIPLKALVTTMFMKKESIVIYARGILP